MSVFTLVNFDRSVRLSETVIWLCTVTGKSQFFSPTIGKNCLNEWISLGAAVKAGKFWKKFRGFFKPSEMLYRNKICKKKLKIFCRPQGAVEAQFTLLNLFQSRSKYFNLIPLTVKKLEQKKRIFLKISGCMTHQCFQPTFKQV